jgi:hypothetical protein
MFAAVKLNVDGPSPYPISPASTEPHVVCEENNYRQTTNNEMAVLLFKNLLRITLVMHFSGDRSLPQPVLLPLGRSGSSAAYADGLTRSIIQAPRQTAGALSEIVHPLRIAVLTIPNF